MRSVAFVGLFNVFSARVDVVLKMAKTSRLKKVKELETKLDCKLVYDDIVKGRITKGNFKYYFPLLFHLGTDSINNLSVLYAYF